MNTSKLFEVKNNLKRLQANGDTLETLLKGFDAKQNEKYAETVRKQIFQTEEAYFNAMEEFREIQSFLYDA
tara:strand:+ start:1015 stop:1227 length:213 start_codon:yes stop_codon:yes gene_type:complete